MISGVFIFYCIVATSLAQEEVNNRSFPNEFMFGVGSSAYQIEGAWDEDGKGENIWDHFVHNNNNPIENGATGDVACDSYHKFTEDVSLLKDLGVDHYLFSLSWTRILPNGTNDKINTAGVDYYKNLLQELRDNGIEPIVTLYHMDLPQILQKQGGWVDSFIIDVFADYARVCFELFGDNVKYWLTFNEPKETCLSGYGFGTMPPAIMESGILDYKCSYNLLRAHAKAWHIYDEEFRANQNGKVSIGLSTNWFEPVDENSDNMEAAETKRQYTFGWFANPIFNGDYPEIMKYKIADRSRREGRRTSRLPQFTSEELTYILGTQDFLAVNTYTTTLIENPREEPEVARPNYNDDVGVDEYYPSWLEVDPPGIRKLLNWIKDTYSNPDIFIMGNGVSENGSSLNDESRIDYHRNYLSNIRSAMEDGANVIGYTAWSLMDSFQWMSGYSQKFGLYSVDFDSENRTRTPKSSVEFFKKIVSTHCLVESCEEV